MPPTLKTLAYRYLRERIESGVFAPGSRLAEIPLAEAIGISRTPVREAIRQLAAEGFVEMTPHAGACVRCPDADEVRDLYELREVLEVYAVTRLADGDDEEAKVRLTEICRAMRALLKEAAAGGAAQLSVDATRRQQALDQEFHQRIVAASGNAQLVKVMQEFHVLGRIFDLMETEMPIKTLRSTCRCHEQIARAVRKGEGPTACEALCRHIRSGLTARLQVLASAERADVPASLRPFV